MLTKIKKGSNDYAAYEKKCDVSELDQISIQMINSNRKTNTGLAGIICESMNEECERILFDITDKITLSEFISRKVTQEEFRNMLLGLIDTVEGFDEYMIGIEQIVLDTENVYINEAEKTAMFICLPLKSYKSETGLYEFFRNIVKNSYVEYEVNEVNYFNSANNIVQNESTFSLTALREAMEFTNSQAVADNDTAEDQVSEIIHESTIAIPDANAGVLEAPEPEEAEMPYVPAPNMQNGKEKKGLLGKLFGDKKKKEKTAAKPAAQNEQAPAQVPAAHVQNVQNQEEDFAPSGLSKLRKKTEKKPEKTSSKKSNLFGKKKKDDAVNAPVQQPAVPPVQPIQQLQPVQLVQPAVQQIQPVQQVQPAVQQIQPVQQVQPAVQQLHPVKQIQSAPSPAVSVPKTEPAPQPSPVSLPEFDDDYIGTTLLKYDSPETTALKGTPTVKGYLIRRANRQSVEIRKSVFAIGRDRGDQDLQINDNTAVGHKHAYIIRKNTFFFVVDNNSMNHTYLNGNVLDPNVEYKLNNGDKLLFADEEFDFRIF